jgi:hypothetical protein
MGRVCFIDHAMDVSRDRGPPKEDRQITRGLRSRVGMCGGKLSLRQQRTQGVGLRLQSLEVTLLTRPAHNERNTIYTCQLERDRLSSV